MRRCVMRELFKRTLGAAIIGFIFVMCSTAVFAGTKAPDKIYSKTPILAYTLKGLNHNRAIQNFSIGTTYIYITQRIDSTTYLSRCLMNGNTATYVDEMTLTDFGHGESLDIYSYDNENYIYVGCKQNGQASTYFALQAGRILYTPGATFSTAGVSRFTYMNYANKAATSIGTLYRTAVGGNSDYTIFRVQSADERIRYSIYRTASLNKFLDSEMTVDIRSSAARNACVTSFVQNKWDLTDDYLNGSFQGMDMVGNTSIYVSGGIEGETPRIALMNNAGSCLTLIKVTGLGTREIEGVKVRDNRVYFLIIPDTEHKTDTQRIYYFPTSAFQ
jgi:hypothetical protein